MMSTNTKRLTFLISAGQALGALQFLQESRLGPRSAPSAEIVAVREAAADSACFLAKEVASCDHADISILRWHASTSQALYEFPRELEQGSSAPASAADAKTPFRAASFRIPSRDQ